MLATSSGFGYCFEAMRIRVKPILLAAYGCRSSFLNKDSADLKKISSRIRNSKRDSSRIRVGGKKTPDPGSATLGKTKCISASWFRVTAPPMELYCQNSSKISKLDRS
jgi:hypothetical protein